MYRVNTAKLLEEDVDVLSPSMICESNLEISILDTPNTDAHPKVVRFNATNGPSFSRTLP